MPGRTYFRAGGLQIRGEGGTEDGDTTVTTVYSASISSCSALPGQAMRNLVGNFRDTEDAAAAMGISWMTRDEMRQAVPPAYMRFIATHGARGSA